MKKEKWVPKLPKKKYLLNVGGKKFKANTFLQLIWRFITKKPD